jgi:hypothetical protein
MQCLAIGIAVHRDCSYPKRFGRSHNPNGNLAPIGNEELLYFRAHLNTPSGVPQQA